MTNLFRCRRTFTALYTITLMALLGAYLKQDLSGAMAVVAIALSGSNAAQAVLTSRNGVVRDTKNAGNGSTKDTIK